MRNLWNKKAPTINSIRASFPRAYLETDYCKMCAYFVGDLFQLKVLQFTVSAELGANTPQSGRAD